MKRKTALITGEYYHIFNRGVDKRQVFMDAADQERFIRSMLEFNVPGPTGGLYANSFKERQLRGFATKLDKLVDIVAYCLNLNHFHFLFRQMTDDGIQELLHKVGTGYTRYFNDRYERSGALFQGPFQSVHIENNEQLLYVSAYVNLNNHVHTSFSEDTLVRSSWREYTVRGVAGMCEKDIILSQFKDVAAYEKFAKETVVGIKKRRKQSGEASLEASPLG